MGLKERIKKLEQSHGIDTPQKLMILIMFGSRRPPTDAEIEAQKKAMKWGDSPQFVLWNGERFFDDLDDYVEADNHLTDAEIAEGNEKILAEMREGVTP